MVLFWEFVTWGGVVFDLVTEPRPWTVVQNNLHKPPSESLFRDGGDSNSHNNGPTCVFPSKGEQRRSQIDYRGTRKD